MSFSIDIRGPTCPTCGHEPHHWEWDGMTYNLEPMFRLAGFFDAMKGPKLTFLEFVRGNEPQTGDEICASDLAPLVRKGLEDMRARPAEYIALEPPNKWGDYHGAVEFTEKLLAALETAPAGAKVYFSG